MYYDDIGGILKPVLSALRVSALPDSVVIAHQSFVHHFPPRPFQHHLSLQSFSCASHTSTPLHTRSPHLWISRTRKPFTKTITFVSKPHRIDTPAPILERHNAYHEPYRQPVASSVEQPRNIPPFHSATGQLRSLYLEPVVDRLPTPPTTITTTPPDTRDGDDTRPVFLAALLSRHPHGRRGRNRGSKAEGAIPRIQVAMEDGALVSLVLFTISPPNSPPPPKRKEEEKHPPFIERLPRSLTKDNSQGIMAQAREVKEEAPNVHMLGLLVRVSGLRRRPRRGHRLLRHQRSLPQAERADSAAPRRR